METLSVKYRPLDFDSVVGQDAIVTTLKNQIASGNIAHAYLFSGIKGTGKTTVARIFARAVNCPNEINGNPCNVCDVCKAAIDGADFNILELDAASNGNVEKIRQITESMSYRPINDEKYKVYIIDEAHALTGFSKEAFLKSLEEPPEYVIYILATTDPNKLPGTILSRCQKYNFKRINIETIVSNLKNICEKEHIEIDDEALTFIAERGDGSMRDSITELDRCRSYSKEKLTKEKVVEILGITSDEEFSKILKAVNERDVNTALAILGDAIDKGKDVYRFADDLIWHIRNVLIAKSLSAPIETLNITTSNFEKLKKESESISKDVLIYFIEELSKTLNAMRYDENRRIIFETALIRLSYPETNFLESAVMARIKKVEENIASGSFTRIEKIVSNESSKKENASDLKKDVKESKDNKIHEIKLSKLTFDEIGLIKDNWNSIKSSLDRTAKNFLQFATLIPGSEKEPGFVKVLLADEYYTILNGMRSPDENYKTNLEVIEARLSESAKNIIKKDVMFKIVEFEKENYTENVTFKLDDAISKIIDMEIKTEDD